MSRTFTKLFSSITESTVWCEPDTTRLLWICMLAMADRNGRVWGSVPGLANRARIPLDSAREAIATFLAPDPDSRTPAFEGRRIEIIDDGWRLLNHEKYRSIRDEETTLEAKRNYINARRAKEREAKGVDQSRSQSNAGEHGRDSAEADTEAYTEEKRERVANARATRLPTPFVLPSQWADFSAKERPDLDPAKVAEKFADHWKAKPGKAGTKLDWFATWRNWIREERAPAGGAMTFKERDAANAAARVSEMTGGLVSAKPVSKTRRNDALQEVFDAPKLLG